MKYHNTQKPPDPVVRQHEGNLKQKNMDKKRFRDLVFENKDMWKNGDPEKETQAIISFCYDILCDDKEFGKAREELSAAKQELTDANKKIAELESYQSKYFQEIGNASAYRKATKALVELTGRLLK